MNEGSSALIAILCLFLFSILCFAIACIMRKRQKRTNQKAKLPDYSNSNSSISKFINDTQSLSRDKPILSNSSTEKTNHNNKIESSTQTISPTERFILNQLQNKYGIEHIPVYHCGTLMHISGISDEDIYENRQFAYSANIFISDEKFYNLNNLDSIATIEIPTFSELEGIPDVTSDLSYILKMRACAIESPDFARVLIPITYKMMLASPIGFSRKDYMRLAIQLWNNGLLAEGDKLKEDIEQSIKAKDSAQAESMLSAAKELDTDLVVSSFLIGTCSECAKFQGRVYSISGKSKKYPKLPEYALKHGRFHEGCRHRFFPFSEGFSTLQTYSEDRTKLVTVDPVKYSNRPYVDDRTEEDIKEYNSYLAYKQQEIDYEKSRREINENKYNGIR